MTNNKNQMNQMHTKPADEVYVNGRFYTVDAQRSWAEAVAISDGRFVYVGDHDGVQAYIGEETKVSDVAGKMVMPGLHDMHMHGVHGALGKLFHCKFPFTSSVEEIAEAVGAFAAANPHEAWVVGGAWLMSIAGEIDKAILDAVVPDRPVFLWDAGNHNAWVNSKALEVAGITRETPNPSDGIIGRDKHGNPTGLLLEGAAIRAWRHVPERTDEEHQQAILWLADTLNQLGITSIKEAAVDRATMRAYKALNDAGKLNLRVGCHFLWLTAFLADPDDLEPLLNDRHQYAGDRVQVEFLKLFLDGVPVARTAAMLKPYTGDDPATHDPHALLLVDPETLKEVLIRFDREGLLVKMHATGDASLRAALDAIEAARLFNGDSGIGHEIAHPQNVSSADLPRFAQLGAVPDLCPILWHPSRNKELNVKAAVGAERVERSWPIGSYHRSGAHLIAGTDWPAMAPTPNNWLGMQTMITREDPTGAVLGKLGDGEEIDLATAIEIYTINGAKAARHADRVGSIEVGKSADFIILDRNLFEISPHDIGRTQVLKTVLDGQTVWQQ